MATKKKSRMTVSQASKLAAKYVAARAKFVIGKATKAQVAKAKKDYERAVKQLKAQEKAAKKKVTKKKVTKKKATKKKATKKKATKKKTSLRWRELEPGFPATTPRYPGYRISPTVGGSVFYVLFMPTSNQDDGMPVRDPVSGRSPTTMARAKAVAEMDARKRGLIGKAAKKKATKKKVTNKVAKKKATKKKATKKKQTFVINLNHLARGRWAWVASPKGQAAFEYGSAFTRAGAVRGAKKAIVKAGGKRGDLVTIKLTNMGAVKKKKVPKKKVAKKKVAKKTGRKMTLKVNKTGASQWTWILIFADTKRTKATGKSKTKGGAVKGGQRKLEKGQWATLDAGKASDYKPTKKKVAKKKPVKIAKGRCARKGPISSKARKELPAKAFGLPKKRAYPLYKMGGDGKLVPSSTHANNAKARARQSLDGGSLTRTEYRAIVRKANQVLAKCGSAAKKARKSGKAKGARSCKLTEAQRRVNTLREISRLAGV